MLTDPSADLQKAITDLLLADADLAALIGDRIFDRIPDAPTFPYVSWGEIQIIPDLGEDTDAAQCFITLHSWDRFVTGQSVRSVAAILVGALHDREVVIDDGQVQSLLLQSSRTLKDPDGLTSHGVHTFEVLTDANA